MRLRGWYLVLSWLKLFHVVIMYVLVFANVSLKCSVLFRLCLQKRRLCVILPKSGRLEALDKDECVAYHRHGRRKKAGATQQWPPRHYMSWPGRLLTCFFPAYLHLLTYFCLHTLSVTLRSAWERGELYLVLHCCVQLPHIEGGGGVAGPLPQYFLVSQWDNVRQCSNTRQNVWVGMPAIS